MRKTVMGLALAAPLALGLIVSPPAAAQTGTTAQQGERTAAQMLEDRVLGNPDAPVTIIDYSSMTCPHCAAFHTETLPELKKQFIDTGKAKLVFRDFPFDRVALSAAMLARCLPSDRYFGMLDVLFRSQGTWARAPEPQKALGQTARLAGLGEKDFEACLANQELMNGVVQKRMEGEQQFQISSTPTFIVQQGGKQEKIVGNQPLQAFVEAIEKVSP